MDVKDDKGIVSDIRFNLRYYGDYNVRIVCKELNVRTWDKRNGRNRKLRKL